MSVVKEKQYSSLIYLYVYFFISTSVYKFESLEFNFAPLFYVESCGKVKYGGINNEQLSGVNMHLI